MNTRERVVGIFRDIFDDPSLEISDQTTAADVDEWDSLAHINLVVAMEKEFKIKFALGELQAMRNVGDMMALIEKKTNTL